MLSAKPIQRDPWWVRAMAWYVVLLAVFGLAVYPYLSKSTQEAMWIHRPLGRIMMLIYAFLLPVVWPLRGDADRLLCVDCGSSNPNDVACVRCGGKIAKIPPKPPSSLRRRLLFGFCFAAFFVLLYVYANWKR